MKTSSRFVNKFVNNLNKYMDKATLVLFGIYHGQANPERLTISDIDTLIQMEGEFDDRHGDADWEDSATDWADSVAQWYNDTKPNDWNLIEMAVEDPYFKVKQEMGRYLSIDSPEGYDLAIKALKSALKSKKKRKWLIDNLENVPVWQKVEMEFTVEDFCELIGLTN